MKQLTIGGVTFALPSDWLIPDHYTPFLSEQVPDISLQPLPERPPLPEDGPRFQPPEGMWDVQEWKGRLAFRTFAPEPGIPDRVLLMDGDFRRGEIHAPAGSAPFLYPLDELIMNGYLATGAGLMIHACGVVAAGQGWLFPGFSGAGKSTLAGLAAREPGMQVLSDDRVIVRPVTGGFRLFGTPWHGDHTAVSAAGAPLEAVFFLKHGAENRLRRLPRAEAAARLLANSFSPLWDRAACARNLDFCGQLVAAVPAHELEFLPDRSALQFLPVWHADPNR